MRRSRLTLALGLGTAAVAVAGLPAASPVFAPARAVLGIDDRLTNMSTVALTFDDGPHPQGTPAILDVLERFGIQATFFLVGEQVAARPSLAAEIVARGHEIGLHSYSHRVVAWLAPRAFREELDRTVAAVFDATGQLPDLYRPPRGVFTYGALAEIRQRGWHPVLWAADGRDWRASATPAGICGRIARRLSGGEVVLLHDSDFYAAPGSWQATADALALLLPKVRIKSLSPVPLTRPLLTG